jgi:anaerobic selenocysteine-containing dehydrogenase
VNGEFIAFRNWQNPQHVADTARVWNVEPATLPTWTPPTHAMQIFSFAESGSIRFLWIIGTNPAVSLPEVTRIRKILKSEDLFVVVSDAFLTETAQLADVVLPAALWGEKTGCTTNADRTVHLSEKAIDPPGEARSDLEALVDYARRMGFKDKDGQPLVKWTDRRARSTAGGNARAVGRATTRHDLREAPRRQRDPVAVHGCSPERHGAPVHRRRVQHRRRLLRGVRPRPRDGAAITPTEYAARDPKGRAIIKGAEYLPPPEEPDDEYPLLLTTGRVTHHFHTRTKTGGRRRLTPRLRGVRRAVARRRGALRNRGRRRRRGSARAEATSSSRPG